MAKYKMFEMIIDDGQHVFKAARIGKTKTNIMDEYSGNGKFIRVKEVTDDYPISIYKVIEALKDAHFGNTEQEAIAHLLRTEYGNAVE